MTTKRAIIAGAGIGGPVLGLWLRRLGWEVTLLEARARIDPEVGAFLGLSPNGLYVLDQLGLAERVLAIGHGCESFRFLNRAGKVIGTIDRSRDRDELGWPLTMVRRGDLHALLVQAATDAGVKLRLNARVVGLRDEPPGPVEVKLGDGATLGGDLLFGCDGVRSTVRGLAIPGAPPPRSNGLLDFGGFSKRAVPFPTGVNVMVFGRHAFFGVFATPGGETWWFHNGPEGSSPDGHRARMLALHASDPPWIRDVIDKTETLLGPWPLHELPSLPRWHHGRVCLLGDAAHAMSPSAGQGASMAMEDALVIARSLCEQPDAAAAFDAYERSRRKRVERIAAVARRNDGGKKGTGPVAAWFLARMMKYFMPRAAAQQTRVYAHRETFPAQDRPSGRAMMA